MLRKHLKVSLCTVSKRGICHWLSVNLIPWKWIGQHVLRPTKTILQPTSCTAPWRLFWVAMPTKQGLTLGQIAYALTSHTLVKWHLRNSSRLKPSSTNGSPTLPMLISLKCPLKMLKQQVLWLSLGKNMVMLYGLLILQANLSSCVVGPMLTTPMRLAPSNS